MEHRAPSSSAVSFEQFLIMHTTKPRGAWVLTAYGISGWPYLACCCITSRTTLLIRRGNSGYEV